MKKVGPLLVVLGAVLAIAVVYYACRKDDEPRAAGLSSQPFTLGNGLVGEIVHGDCGEQVAVVVLFGVGASHDPPGRSGMTEVVRRIFSASVAPEQAERRVDGGSDHTVYSAVVSGDRLGAELDAAAGRMARLEIGEAALEAARTEVLAGIRQRSGGDAPLTAMTDAAESIQPSRGNGRRGGIAAEVEAITIAEVDAFWRAHFTPANARLVIVGRIDAAAARASVDAAFGALPPGDPAVLRPPGESTVIGTLVMGDAPTAVAIAVPAPPPSDDLYPAFLVLAARLQDGAPGARTWASSFDPIVQSDTLFVTGGVQPPEAPEPAAARIRAEVTALLGKELGPAEVAAARERFGLFAGLKDADPTTCKADPRRLAIARARRAQLGLEKVDLGAGLDEVTQAEVTDAVALFDPKRTTAVIAGGVIR
jgi:predicted Zn-dependent peptidase